MFSCNYGKLSCKNWISCCNNKMFSDVISSRNKMLLKKRSTELKCFLFISNYHSRRSESRKSLHQDRFFFKHSIFTLKMIHIITCWHMNAHGCILLHGKKKASLLLNHPTRFPVVSNPANRTRRPPAASITTFTCS